MLTQVQQKRRDAIKRANNVIPSKERYKYNLENVQEGGFIAYKNQNWLINSKSFYVDVKWSNFQKRKKDYIVTELELFSLKTGESKYLEYEKDDALEVYETTKDIKLRALEFNGAALKQRDLEAIAEEEEGEIVYDGKSFFYLEDDTWAALYYKNSLDEEGVPVRFFAFEAEDGTALNVEVWHDEIGDSKGEREAFLSEEVKLKAFEVLQVQS